MKVLISPAKTIDIKEIDRKIEFSIAQFLEESNQLVKKLKKLSVKKIESLMHVSTDLAHLNHSRFQNWLEPLELTTDVSLAIFTFNGEVYKGFDAKTLNEEQLKSAQNKIRILSGLYGILKPLDLLFPYRLEMGTKWEITPKQKNLYQFWGNKLSLYLNKEMEKGEVIINLASNEYFKAIDYKILKNKIITPVFKEFKNGDYKIVMMYAKHARGAMARYIVINNIESAEELKLYSVDGYSFDVNQSTESEWVFTR
ncbi:MAG: hypothetical protein RI883_1315 [Bacteroidota bacterium]|jgi:cytoplasmic iron level regulating protein YaaA (DUF328/UPF0246 family)